MGLSGLMGPVLGGAGRVVAIDLYWRASSASPTRLSAKDADVQQVRDISRFIALYKLGKLPIDRTMSQPLGSDQLNGRSDFLRRFAMMRQVPVLDE